MNPKFNRIETGVTVSQKSLDFAKDFLGDAAACLDEKIIRDSVSAGEAQALLDIAGLEKDHPLKRQVGYNSFEESFSVKNEKGLTLGTVVAARHLGIGLTMPESFDRYQAFRDARTLIREKMTEDAISSSLNRKLAESLAGATESRDTLLSKAYRAVSERTETYQEQLGVRAEQMMVGKLEAIAIDNPELGIVVAPANAFQDVGEKIDFLISTTSATRGIGVEEQEGLASDKHIGIQFTINASKESAKLNQIAQSKKRGVDVDDIMLVTIDMDLFQKAISEWEEKGKSVRGPWEYLPENIRRVSITELFKSVLTDEQIGLLLEKET